MQHHSHLTKLVVLHGSGN